MKFIFFSDIHGNIYSFNKFLIMLEHVNVDKVVFCGDIFGYYYHQNEIIDILRNRKDISCIKGNHDQLFLDILNGKLDEELLIPKYGSSYKDIHRKISIANSEFIKQLPEFIEFNYNVSIGVFHGTPYDLLNGRLYPDTKIENESLYLKYDYIILGHTHHKMVRNLYTTTIINPGSIGQQRDGKGVSFLLFNSVTLKYEFFNVTYDIELLVNDINKFDEDKPFLKEVLYRN